MPGQSASCRQREDSYRAVEPGRHGVRRAQASALRCPARQDNRRLSPDLPDCPGLHWHGRLAARAALPSHRRRGVLVLRVGWWHSAVTAGGQPERKKSLAETVLGECFDDRFKFAAPSRCQWQELEYEP